MLINCPHCYTRIVPKSDGSCPACQKNTQDTTGLDVSRTSIHVSQGDILPAVCCDCGQPTSRTVAVYRKSSGGDEPSTALGLAIIVLVSWLAGLLLLLRGAANKSVAQVKIPQCEACAERGSPEPRFVDFANARMTFIVHKNLKDAMPD
jgi:hypothetical protein